MTRSSARRDELDLATLHGDILVWLNALATVTVAAWGGTRPAPMESEGGAMATPLRTLGWNTWTVIFALLILLLGMVYLAY